MLATSERSSASLARSRAARSPAATRAASTSGSNGMRITSSAPASSAARSSSGESRSTHTTTCTAASSGRARTAAISAGPLAGVGDHDLRLARVDASHRRRGLRDAEQVEY